jgi:hypothetical protein
MVDIKIKVDPNCPSNLIVVDMNKNKYPKPRNWSVKRYIEYLMKTDQIRVYKLRDTDE